MRERPKSSGGVPSLLEVLEHRLACIDAAGKSQPPPVPSWEQALSVPNAPSLETCQPSQDWNKPETPSVPNRRPKERGALRTILSPKEPSRPPFKAAVKSTTTPPSSPVSSQREGRGTVSGALISPDRHASLPTVPHLVDQRVSGPNEMPLVSEKTDAIGRLLTCAGIPADRREPDNSPGKVFEAYGELERVKGTPRATNQRYLLGRVFQLNGSVAAAYRISDAIALVLAAGTSEGLCAAEKVASKLLGSDALPVNEAFLQRPITPTKQKSPAR